MNGRGYPDWGTVGDPAPQFEVGTTKAGLVAEHGFPALVTVQGASGQ